MVPPPQELLGETRDAFPAPWNVFDAMQEVADLVESARAKDITTNYLRTSFFDANERVAAMKIFLPVIEGAATQKGYLPPHKTGCW